MELVRSVVILLPSFVCSLIALVASYIVSKKVFKIRIKGNMFFLDMLFVSATSEVVLRFDDAFNWDGRLLDLYVLFLALFFIFVLTPQSRWSYGSADSDVKK